MAKSAHKSKSPPQVVLSVTRDIDTEDVKPKFRLKGTEWRSFFNHCPWDEWWYEFLTARNKNGRMQYLTAYGFAKEKAQSKAELQVIYRAIGPRPVTFEQTLHLKIKAHSVAVPHLGDWQMLRATAYFSDRPSAQALRKACVDRLNGLEAGRSAATVICDMIDKWLKYDDKIDEVYDGTPVVEGLSATQQEKRAKAFFKYKRETKDAVLQLVARYLECYGIAPGTGLNDLGQLVMAVSQQGAHNALAGAATGAAMMQPNPGVLMLAQAIEEKTRLFKMRPPALLTEEDDEHVAVHR